MKDLTSFDKFKLNKVQMNAIAGGSIYCRDESGKHITYSDGISMEEAQGSADRVLDDPVCEEEIKV